MKKLLTLLMTIALLGAACSSGSDNATTVSDGESESSAEDSSADEIAGGVDADGAASMESSAEGDSASSDESSAEFEGVDDAATEAATSDEESAAEPAPADEPEAIVEPPDAPEPDQSRAGLLTAADIDDNLNITFFADYLERTADNYGQSGLPQVDLGGRVTFNVVDRSGEPVANARLRVESGQADIGISSNPTGAAYLFPADVGMADWDSLDVVVSGPDDRQGQGEGQRFAIEPGNLDDNNATTLELDGVDATTPDGLDVALVIDTTGSMGDELSYLTTEFTSIVSRLEADYPGVEMRFALVVYRDDGDDYVTETYSFTGDVREIQASLDRQFADGGGDYPEAMDAALGEALDLDWRTGNVARVVILNADAPPHDAKMQLTLDHAAEARERGIRIYPLAASGVGDTAEYLMRVMAATTGGRHLFLTDDSGIGFAHQEPKVQCYVVSRLDHLLIRIIGSELATTRIEPLPNQLIRTVGSYDNGYCTDDQ